MKPTLDVLVNEVKDKVAIALQVWGVESDSNPPKWQGYNQVLRGWRPEYATSDTNLPLDTFNDTLKSLLETSLHGSQAIYYGTYRHGAYPIEVTGQNLVSRRVNKPRDQMTLGEKIAVKLGGQWPVINEITRTPYSKKVTVHMPGMHEISSLYQQPEDFGFLVYNFPPCKGQEGRPLVDASRVDIAAPIPIYKKILRFCQENPGQIHELFGRLCGDIPEKEDIYDGSKTKLVGKVRFCQLKSNITVNTESLQRRIVHSVEPKLELDYTKMR